jgi:hypothetical protein
MNHVTLRKRRTSHAGGMEKSLPAYYEGQDCNGEPNHFVPRSEAERLKNMGDARAIHSGRALLILKDRKDAELRLPAPRASSRSAWRVVGQTSRIGVMHKFTRIGPGYPHMELV